MPESTHPLVSLAERAIIEYVKYGERFELDNADPLATQIGESRNERAGTFVSIHKKNGELRGCIGTFVPVRANIVDEVIENSIASATRDPRFYPVQEWELNDLDISVDVLSEPEPVTSVQDLDPHTFGVIVADQKGERRGLLLPMLEQVRTAQEQVAIARQKAYIGAQEPIQLFRFRVHRYH